MLSFYRRKKLPPPRAVEAAVRANASWPPVTGPIGATPATGGDHLRKKKPKCFNVFIRKLYANLNIISLE